MESSHFQPILYVVKGMIIMDNYGKRILAKYFDNFVFPNLKDQRAFEKDLFARTYRKNSEVVKINGITSVYREEGELLFYVLGSCNENEMLLSLVRDCMYDTIRLVFGKDFEKMVLMENLHVALLAFDEICDEGIILETDAKKVYDLVTERGFDIPSKGCNKAKALQAAKKVSKWNFLL